MFIGRTEIMNVTMKYGILLLLKHPEISGLITEYKEMNVKMEIDRLQR
jgi:hypothetical protein